MRLMNILRNIYSSGNTSLEAISSEIDAFRAVYDESANALRVNFLSGETSIGLGDLSDVTISDEVKKGGILTYSDDNGGTWVDQYNVFFEKGQIGEHIIEEMYTAGDVIEDGTNAWDMIEETGGMYIEYKGLPSSFPQFVENNYIIYKYEDLFTHEVLAEYSLKILSITQESASTSGDYTGDMTFLHCEIIAGTFQEIWDSNWIAYSATYTPSSTHTAINIGTGNTIAHNNSHIIGNDITTDAEDTLFVNKLNVSGSINISDVGDPVVTTIDTGKGAAQLFTPGNVAYVYIGGDQTGTITNGNTYSVYNSDGDILLGSWPVASTHYTAQSDNTKVTFIIPPAGIFPGIVSPYPVTNGYLTYTTIPDSQSSIHNLSVTDKLSQGTAVSYLPNMFSKSDIGNLGKYCNITMQRQTNDDTKQNFTIGDTAGLIVIPTNTIYNFRVLGVGADDSGNTATYEIKGTAKNIAGTVTVANVTVTEITDDFTITGMSAEADDTNNALVITATGKAATAINWSAFVEWHEITFA